MYFVLAEFDDWSPDAMISELEEFLRSNNVKAEIERYPQTHHGFAFPGRSLYQAASAERHWERLFDMWRRDLQDAGPSSFETAPWPLLPPDRPVRGLAAG
jgi:carboxymethylenebutenolidase